RDRRAEPDRVASGLPGRIRVPAMNRRTAGAHFVLGSAAASLFAAALLGSISCSRNDSLVLLDLRTSGPLGPPVARVRLSARGWPTRVVTGDIGAGGFLVGYYGP